MFLSIKTRRVAAVVCTTFSLAGCGTTNLAGERLSYTQPSKINNIVHYPGSGGVIISSGRDSQDSYLKAVCVAPPAQAAQEAALKTLTNISGSGSAAAQVPDGSSAQLAASLAASRAYEAVASVSKLFEQNERTLLLQYSLYRLCEAYMNGMFDVYENPALDLLKIQNESKDAPAISALATEHLAALRSAEKRIDDLWGQRTAALERAQMETGEKKKSALAEAQAKDDEIRLWKSLYFKNTYRQAFDSILKTAVELATIEKDRAESEAKRALAEADKARADKGAVEQIAAAEKKAADAQGAAASAKDNLEQMKNKLIDGVLSCVDCKRDDKAPAR